MNCSSGYQTKEPYSFIVGSVVSSIGTRKSSGVIWLEDWETDLVYTLNETLGPGKSSSRAIKGYWSYAQACSVSGGMTWAKSIHMD